VQKKEWLATMDSRVREAHAAMNGEVVGIDEAFSNGSMYPDEPNCRCTILPVLPE
jgi:SPP1 gp7 family putative phage head morphogenesis protein